jgi:ubiquinone/menaquinone biosynthesis C-methylase UbiE
MSAFDILTANELYHDDESASYDEGQPYVRNAFAQAMFINDIRVIINTLAPYTNCPKVLDCGAGTGNLSLKFLAAGCDVTAVDISRGMLKRLSAKAAGIGKGTIEVVHSDIDSFLNTTRKRFDVICSSSFLHHLPDYPATYRSMAKHCSSESIIYTSFEPRARVTLSAAQRLFANTDSGIHEFLSRRMYNPFIVGRAVLRRLHILATPRTVINQLDTSLIERSDSGVETETLTGILRSEGFKHIGITWRPVSRYAITYFLNKRFVRLNNALFMISQRSVSGKQRPIGGEFLAPSILARRS